MTNTSIITLNTQCAGDEIHAEYLSLSPDNWTGPVNWSNGSSGTTIILPEDPSTPPGEYEITLTVTDELGCTGEETIEYEIIEPVEPEIFGPIDFACKDGVDDMVTFTLDFVDVGTGPYDFQWEYITWGGEIKGRSR